MSLSKKTKDKRRNSSNKLSLTNTPMIYTKGPLEKLTGAINTSQESFWLHRNHGKHENFWSIWCSSAAKSSFKVLVGWIIKSHHKYITYLMTLKSGSVKVITKYNFFWTDQASSMYHNKENGLQNKNGTSFGKWSSFLNLLSPFYPS